MFSFGIVLVAATSLYACGGGGSSGGNVSPTPPPATPGPLVASPNPLALQVSSSEPNHSVTLTITQANATGLITSATPSGCTGFFVYSNPFNPVQNLSNGTLTATYASFIGAAPVAEGTCTITFTPASGTPLVLPVVVTP